MVQTYPKKRADKKLTITARPVKQIPGAVRRISSVCDSQKTQTLQIGVGSHSMHQEIADVTIIVLTGRYGTAVNLDSFDDVSGAATY
mmetsp:Transcript_30387/g.70034  ORF Transcript_30387/g.70034 Transcript_30387/m.70034 type:complete len:87 (+) Transcript_30387:872-1132(+)